MTDKTNKLSKRKPPQEKLQASELRYRRLFEAARDGILILDAASRKIIDMNPYMVELLGFSPAELLGKGCSRMCKPARTPFENWSRKAISVTKTYPSKPKRESAGKWSLSATSMWKTAITSFNATFARSPSASVQRKAFARPMTS